MVVFGVTKCARAGGCGGVCACPSLVDRAVLVAARLGANTAAGFAVAAAGEAVAVAGEEEVGAVGEGAEEGPARPAEEPGEADGGVGLAEDFDAGDDGAVGRDAMDDAVHVFAGGAEAGGVEIGGGDVLDFEAAAGAVEAEHEGGFAAAERAVAVDADGEGLIAGGLHGHTYQRRRDEEQPAIQLRARCLTRAAPYVAAR